MPDEPPREHYVWQPPDKPFTIHLAFEVIDRMNVEIMRGFGAVRRRGTEVGGLLLGRIEPGAHHVTVIIDDFEPVPCEYASGPSYILSPKDLQQLRKSLAHFDPSAGRDLYTVGFYRSNTRDGLSLDDYDLKFFREYFPDRLHVALLVKPYATRAGTAGFFFEENGSVKSDVSYLEFPFRRKDLTGEPTENPEAPETPIAQPDPRKLPEPPARASAQAATAALFADTPVKPPDAPVKRHDEAKPIFASYQPQVPRNDIRAGWVVFSLMLVLFGVAAGYRFSGMPALTNAMPSSVDPYALNLTATRVDDNLLIKWDRQSLAVKGGSRGLLTISEGEDNKAVQMDARQLQNGTVLYRHVAPEIHFKLEVFLKEQRSVVETSVWQMN